MEKVVSIGAQDFAKLRANGSFYIDKTELIREWWENQDDVTLITRPRRFGKTLNLNMLECFFSNKYTDRGDLFEGLAIWKYEKFRKLQGNFPVISLSFGNIKGVTFKDTRSAIIHLLVSLYAKYTFLIEEGFLNEKEKAYFDSVNIQMDDATAILAINHLASYLERYYDEKVLVFLDEYDTPLQDAYVNGYWEALTAFIRGLFGSTFKTNTSLNRALLTGITRVSKESIFSDLNNLKVVTTTSNQYSDQFGFTEQEVFDALESFGLGDEKSKVKQWYDGFTFGNTRDIYNPWSITSYLDEKKFKSYWANTSANSLVEKLIRSGSSEIKVAMEDLLDGNSIEAIIDEEILFNQLDQNETAIWSLFLAAGYLKVDYAPEDEEDGVYHLSLTNMEVKKMFCRMIRNWFQKPDLKYNDFVKALFLNDIKYMNQFMSQMSESVFSFFDVGKLPSEKTEPERFYHGFVLGLIADSQINYHITSNRESGFGRYDVVLEPRDKAQNAYVFEFKVKDPECEKTLDDTVKAALKQIDEKNYDAALIERGILRDRIRHYGFAFEGKKVLIGA